MVNIKLLQSYEGHSQGDIIQVSNNVAFGLVEQGVAKYAETRDFLVKPEIGISKAFKGSPARSGYKQRKGRIPHSRNNF